MSYLICLVPKTPVPRHGRIGPTHLQDWYRGCIKAIQLAKEFKGKIFVPTNFVSQGESEADIYAATLKKLGAEDVEIVRHGFETIGQLDMTFRVAEKEGCDLIIVSTTLHFPRVWWLSRGRKKVTHCVVGGMPRPKGAIADIVLTFLFPLIDIIGIRKEFLNYVEERRKRGKV